MHSSSKLTLAAAVTAFLIGAATPVLAQTDASAPVAAAPATAASTPLTKKQARAQRRAQHKAARKAARAKNAAELKKLEQNGYQPGMDDSNYPQNIQNAERKANAPAGASQ